METFTARRVAMAPVWFKLLLFLFLWLWLGSVCRGFNFQHPIFESTDGFSSLVPPEPFYNGSSPMFTSNAIWLTPDPRSTYQMRENQTEGRFVYNSSLQFKASDNDAGFVVSFSTSFTFQIFTPGEYGDCGDGFAFFIAPSIEVPIGSTGEFLGIANGTDVSAQPQRHLFAVEFDTYQNTNNEDISSSHIGIDINGLVSINATDTSYGNYYPQLYLYNNYTFTAWVDYDASSHLIQVWLTNSSSPIQRPSAPCLQVQYDLSTVFKKDMYVGLSASSGDSYEGHVLYSWNFSMDDVLNTGSPSPAPFSHIGNPPVVLNTGAPSPAPFSHIGNPPVAGRPSVGAVNTPHCESCRRKKLIVLVAGAVSGVFIVAAICAFLIIRKDYLGLAAVQSTQAGSEGQRSIELLSTSARRYSYRELRRAAHGFSEREKIGEGGSSSVYKATLPEGSVVAVKRLKEGVKKEAEFASEIGIISAIRHRNLLQLKGWCYEKGEALLLYDYMPNGSLDSYVFGKKSSGCGLDRDTRFSILVGVAAALEYLHGGLGGCILHRDVKAANVLLTERFEAMLGDFGLARLITRNQAVTMTAAGTPGYVAPEIIYFGKASDKADVYSFGVLALEVACGRKVLDVSLPPQEMILLDWVWLLQQSGKLMDALDPSLSEACHADDQMQQLGALAAVQWRCVLHLGLLCCHPFPENRPTMRQVHQSLQETAILPLPSSQPIYPTTTRLMLTGGSCSGSSSRNVGLSAPSGDSSTGSLSAPSTSSSGQGH